MTLTPFVFDITLFTTTLMTLLVIMDPIGTVPVFLALTGRLTAPKQKSAARQATSVSLGIIIAFAILGRSCASCRSRSTRCGCRAVSCCSWWRWNC